MSVLPRRFVFRSRTNRVSCRYIGKYLLGNDIGRGSFGKVMLVRKKGARDRKTYAMKVLRKEAIVQRNQVEHTRAEGEILRSIDHPFLMRLHHAFQTGTKLYFIMDYLVGGELFFHLKNERRFNERRARLYTAEIALGLGHLHEKNIIYRDLKPENILLTQKWVAKLCDFGLSRQMGTLAENPADMMSSNVRRRARTHAHPHTRVLLALTTLMHVFFVFFCFGPSSQRPGVWPPRCSHVWPAGRTTTIDRPSVEARES